MNYERLVELKRWKGVGFGFSVIGGSDTHIPPMICALVRDSPALLSKQVFVGDVLYKVNGISVANLETKEVVDLIRNCEEFIVLSLKEDRLAKLKARPFLAEDTLIEPPRSAGNVYVDSKLNNANSFLQPIGTTTITQYGTEGKFTRRTTVNSYNEGTGTKSLDRIPTRSREEKQSVRQVDMFVNSNAHTDFESSQVYDDHINRLLRLPERNTTVNRMPQSNISNISNIPNISNTTGTKDKYPSEFATTYMSNSISDSVVSFHSNVTTVSKCQSSRPSSGQSLTHTSSGQSLTNTNQPLDYNVVNTSNMLEFSDRSNSVPCASKVNGLLDGNRRYSNPSEDYSKQSSLTESDSNIVPYDIACDTQYDVSNYTLQYSSPNIYNNSDFINMEQRTMSLMPVTQSQHSLNKNFFNEPNVQRHLPQPSVAATSQVPSPGSSRTSSQVESLGVVSTTSLASDEVSPADIASRLFSLNGYKDCDVAPILGKNSQFSKQVCREYLRFFSFDGLSLDDALRIFLKKFPLTGETQERERILIHFSKRYYECNKSPDMSEDALHTLTCALMLLNTDLHRHGITNKMSLNDFINNLSGLCDDGKDFSKEYLKTLYNAIKSKEIIFADNGRSDSITPRNIRKNSAPGNPFVELKTDSKDLVLCEGLIYRKSVMDPGGRRTPAMRRNWRPCFCVLKGLVLYSYKPDNTSSHEPQTLGIHHSLAGYAKDYKKRAFVFKLITADWSVLYIQVKNQSEVKRWMDSINVSAAMLSSPPLPAPCGSSMQFQRPVMPVSRSKLSLEEQLSHHLEKVKTIENELNDHREYTPDTQSKHYTDWENKLDYLEFEVKRFKAYLSVLTAIRLESIRERIISAVSTEPDSITHQSRSSSVHNLGVPASQSNKNNFMKDRKDYYVESP